MKTIEELKTFYEKTLYPDLVELERRRLGIFRGLGFAFVVFLFIGIVLIAVLLPVIEIAAIILPTVVLVLLYLGLCFLLTMGYKKDFKNRVIGRLIRFFDPGLSYFPTEKIPKSVFLHSKLFTTKPNRYKGDDLVRGKIGKTAIEFSEVLAQYVQSNGKTTTVHTQLAPPSNDVEGGPCCSGPAGVSSSVQDIERNRKLRRRSFLHMESLGMLQVRTMLSGRGHQDARQDLLNFGVSL